MGKLIVIEGLDGSGKATQAARLHRALLEEGKQAEMVSFPAYDSDSSALVRMYLAGEFGTQPGDVNAYAASAFYAVDRFASWKTGWGNTYRAGGLILADRYATSNEIHQLAKLPQQEWAAYVEWMEDFEYTRLGIPAPDLVVYLDVDPAVSQQLLRKRYGGEEKRDIHERDTEYLARCREAARWCSDTLGWRRINCTANGAMRSIESIAAEVSKLVKEAI